jgi:DNA-binding transcriptional regulator LsrR (DeoR family)
LLDRVDEALVAIGTLTVEPPLRPGENFFTHEQLEHVRSLGSVGQVNLRFINADGAVIDSELDDMVIGVSPEQLRSYRRSIAAAGGPSKHAAIRSALVGGWVNTLVTDTETANYLLANAP